MFKARATTIKIYGYIFSSTFIHIHPPSSTFKVKGVKTTTNNNRKQM
jgi:hypothetical protein